MRLGMKEDLGKVRCLFLFMFCHFMGQVVMVLTLAYQAARRQRGYLGRALGWNLKNRVSYLSWKSSEQLSRRTILLQAIVLGDSQFDKRDVTIIIGIIKYDYLSLLFPRSIDNDGVFETLISKFVLGFCVSFVIADRSVPLRRLSLPNIV